MTPAGQSNPTLTETFQYRGGELAQGVVTGSSSNTDTYLYRQNGTPLDETCRCPRVQALLSAMVLFAFLPSGFTHREVRDRLAALLGRDPGTRSPGWVTYDLRRLRLHGLIARTPGTQRYQPTDEELRVALFCSRVYLRVLRHGLAQALAPGVVWLGHLPHAERRSH